MENRLKFLDEAPESLASGGEISKLSSHFRYLRYLFLQQGEWNIPKKKDPLPSSCSHCFVNFEGTPYSITVKPSKKPSRNVMRIMEKKASSEMLTAAESAILAHHQDTRGKTLILKCGICQKETEAVLKKLKEDSRAKLDNASTSNKDNKGFPLKKNTSALPPKSVSKSTPNIKKKKKKDQFAGLKKTAVMSLKSKKKL